VIVASVPALVFYGENQSQDCCIQPALDSPARTDPMLRSLYPTGLGFSGENRLDVEIIVSDRPWCFSARTDQMVVQVFDEFSTGVEVLFNYLVFALCTPSCSSLRESVKSMFF
jgi:hypothetical protein